MIVYAESSAVLSWLLGEPTGARIKEILAAAEFVVTSDLTLVECDRTFHRGQSSGRLTDLSLTEHRDELARVAAGWVLLSLDDDVIARARETFPDEPIRSLDALHLATALGVCRLVPETVLLSLDGRVRGCAQKLGIEVLPG